MADRPIIFSGPMVRELLAGSKTQTWRILTPQPDARTTQCSVSAITRPCQWMGIGPSGEGGTSQWDPWRPLRFSPGDRLYVREHWKTMALHDRVSPKEIGRRYAGSVYGRSDACPVVRLADNDRSGQWADAIAESHVNAWKPGKHRRAMHMPRWASRLTLIVEDVRIERLRAISAADVLAEGAPIDPNHRDTTQDGSNPVMCVGDRPWVSQSPHAWYHRLWDNLHGEGSWEANPFVVALTFRVESSNIDRIAA